MRISPASSRCLLFGISLLITTPGFSQSSSEDASSRLVVTVAEYRTELNPPPNASSTVILGLLLQGDAKPVRTIRVPTLTDCPAIFRAGERVGFPNPASGKDGDLAFVELGTTMQFTTQRKSSEILMQPDYTTASLADKGKVGAQPSVRNVTAQGTYSFKLGEPVLVAGLTAIDGFYLIATVTEPAPRSEPND